MKCGRLFTQFKCDRMQMQLSDFGYRCQPGGPNQWLTDGLSAIAFNIPKGANFPRLYGIPEPAIEG